MNILGINAHEESVSGCRIEFLDNKITVHDIYLWVGQELEYVPWMTQQVTTDFEIRDLCIIQHERTKRIIEYLSMVRSFIKILQVSEPNLKNMRSLVSIIMEKIVLKDIVFSKNVSQLEGFFQRFSTNAALINELEKNEYETSYVWAFILACHMAPNNLLLKKK